MKRAIIWTVVALALISFSSFMRKSDYYFCNEPDMVATFKGRGGYDECVYLRGFYAKERREREARGVPLRREQ